MKTSKIAQRWAAQCWETVEVILASPRIFRYTIGLTKSVQKRRAPYKATHWPHLVVLADNLTVNIAINLERLLQERVQELKKSVSQDQQLTDAIWKAGNASVRNGPKSSTGGVSMDGNEASYSVYIAFRESNIGEVSESSGRFCLELCEAKDPYRVIATRYFKRSEDLSAAAAYYDNEIYSLWCGELAVPIRQRIPLSDKPVWIYYWWNNNISIVLGLPEPEHRGAGYMWSDEVGEIDVNPVTYDAP